MDSFTHIALGACVGELLLADKLGKKALLWGIAAQNLPDIDSIAALFVPADQALLIHRGIMHSLFFALVAGLCLALMARRMHYKDHIALATLAFFFCFQLALHDMLDTCNSYGTALFAPFSQRRFSFNLLYVADPLFTGGLVAAAAWLMIKPANNLTRRALALTGIALSVCYLCFAWLCRGRIDREVKSTFPALHIDAERYFCTPAPFTCMLWYVVAPVGSGYYTGYRSIWDDRAQPVSFSRHPVNNFLQPSVTGKKPIKNLMTFAGGYYTLSVSHPQNRQSDSIINFNILRFGQIQGWQNHDAPFALSYPLSATNNQTMILQKGRLAGWSLLAIKIYLDRIAGRQTQVN